MASSELSVLTKATKPAKEELGEKERCDEKGNAMAADGSVADGIAPHSRDTDHCTGGNW